MAAVDEGDEEEMDMPLDDDALSRAYADASSDDLDHLSMLIATAHGPHYHHYNESEGFAARVTSQLVGLVTPSSTDAVLLTRSRRGQSLCAVDPSYIASLIAAADAADAIASAQPPTSTSVSIASIPTPTSHGHAMKLDRQRWWPAEIKELQNHKNNGSFKIYDYCDAVREGLMNLLSPVWVYKNKRDGSAKARLCVNGKAQVLGVDFDQVFAGALRGASLRKMAALMARYGLKSNRTDFTAAYLQGTLLDHEVIWMRMPPGHVTQGRDGKDRVLKVIKPIYGLRQAGRRFQRVLFPWLRAWNDGKLRQLGTDNCIFFAVERDSSGKITDMLIVGVYVDDIVSLYLRDDPRSLWARFKDDLGREWQVEDEGELTDLINIQMTCGAGTVKLHQTNYIDVLVARFCPDGVPADHDAKQTPYSMDLPAKIERALAQKADDIDPKLRTLYQSIVGAELYAAMNTRPDIAYPVGMLSRAMHKPTPELYDEALLVIYYLSKHRHVGLTYEADPTDLECFSDSDWAVRKSTTGWLVRFQQAVISWASRQQPTVALSSCEAELMAASDAAKDVKYRRMMADEFELDLDGPTEVNVDNKAAADTAYNPEHHDKVKHIERRHFFIRELVEAGEIVVPLISTHANLADFLTKPLKPARFFELRDAIMNITY